MRAIEFLTEARNRMFQYIKSVLPNWPDYVLKDWVYGLARGDHQAGVYFKPDDDFDKWGFNKETILKMVKDSGLSPDTKWQLIPNMKFTMDMFEPKTKQRLIGRAGGSSDLGMGIPKDKERHATQAALAQQQGGVRSEPVLLIKSANGYELLEGWHRTIQHFHKFPDGYTGPAYVAVAQSKQGVAEGFNGGDIELSHSMSPDILYVHVTSDGSDVGGARFKKIDGVWTGDIVHVYPQFRRQGVATKIYDYAEELVGKINPSKTLKPKGKKFWSSRDTQGVAEEQLDEKWTKKYKDSINCSNPKGFSQKAHCAGKQKNESSIMQGLNQIDEGWKEKLGAAALTGAMALGAAGANARVTPGDDPNINRLTGKPNVTQPVQAQTPTKAEAPKGFSKEYLQSVVNGTHPRPMISVEKAQELLKNMP